MRCERCNRNITAGQPCDYHELGCTGGLCRCDTTKVVHRRCCERCSPQSVRAS